MAGKKKCADTEAIETKLQELRHPILPASKKKCADTEAIETNSYCGGNCEK